MATSRRGKPCRSLDRPRVPAVRKGGKCSACARKDCRPARPLCADMRLTQAGRRPCECGIVHWPHRRAWCRSGAAERYIRRGEVEAPAVTEAPDELTEEDRLSIAEALTG
jgi:hypothetical protein